MSCGSGLRRTYRMVAGGVEIFRGLTTSNFGVKVGKKAPAELTDQEESHA